MLASLTI